jgi:hypothetical protein
LGPKVIDKHLAPQAIVHARSRWMNCCKPVILFDLHPDSKFRELLLFILQDLLQSCSRGGMSMVEDMCMRYDEPRRARECSNGQRANERKYTYKRANERKCS